MLKLYSMLQGGIQSGRKNRIGVEAPISRFDRHEIARGRNLIPIQNLQNERGFILESGFNIGESHTCFQAYGNRLRQAKT